METLEEMQARHRKEKRDLQSVITSKKKSASKKTRKGVNAECDELERRLQERQEGEASRLQNGGGHEDEAEPEPEDDGVDDVVDRLEKTNIHEEVPKAKVQTQTQEGEQQVGAGAGAGAGNKKRNRQKERLARRQAEQVAAAEKAEEEAKGMTDNRGLEKERMKATFERNGLVEREIRPDGHCLFSAVADQLAQLDIPLGGSEEEEPGYKKVRVVATRWMETHQDDFAPFLEEPLEGYVVKMRDTAEWGGQLELAALANVYGVEIRVVQDGKTEEVKPSGEESGESPPVVWLAYYRHTYGLGEHYNSLRKTTP